MLGQKKTDTDRRKIYLNIKDGAIIKRTAQGEERYSYVEGRLERISQKERNFRGSEVVVYWYVDLRDTESGDLYSLGFSFASNVFKSIVLQLASDEGLEAVKNGSTLRIEPYSRNGYDKVQVWGGGVKLDWVVRELPAIEETIVAGRKVRDDSKRMELISSLAEKIGKLTYK